MLFNKQIFIVTLFSICFQIICYDPKAREIANNGLGDKLVEAVKERDPEILTFYIDYYKPKLSPDEMENTLFALELLCIDCEDALEGRNYSRSTLARKKESIHVLKANIEQELSKIVEK